jgi:hypothetical protein
VFLKANSTASCILFVSSILNLSSSNNFILSQLFGNKTILKIFLFSSSLTNFSKQYHLSVQPKNIVQTLSLYVFIASIVLSGVVEIASSIKVIHL